MFTPTSFVQGSSKPVPWLAICLDCVCLLNKGFLGVQVDTRVANCRNFYVGYYSSHLSLQPLEFWIVYCKDLWVDSSCQFDEPTVLANICWTVAENESQVPFFVGFTAAAYNTKNYHLHPPKLFQLMISLKVGITVCSSLLCRPLCRLHYFPELFY